MAKETGPIYGVELIEDLPPMLPKLRRFEAMHAANGLVSGFVVSHRGRNSMYYFSDTAPIRCSEANLSDIRWIDD